MCSVQEVASWSLIADRVVDARIILRLTLGEPVEEVAALDSDQLDRRLDERLGGRRLRLPLRLLRRLRLLLVDHVLRR